MVGNSLNVSPVLLLGFNKNLNFRTDAERNSSAGTKAR